MKNKATSVDKKKASSQQIDKKTANGSKTKSTRRAMSQTQRIEEDFDEQLLEIDLKKPRNPFNFFISEMLIKEKGQIDSKYMKEFGKRFKTISEKEKIRFSDLAEKDKERFEEHLNLVHANLIKKPAKENKTGYRFFYDEHIGKALEKGEDAADARKSASEKWDKLDEEEKGKYEKLSEKNREFYERLRQFGTGKLSAYTLYSRDKRAEARDKGNTLTFTDCAGLWKKSKESTKEKYEDYAKELKEEFEKNRDMIEITFNLKPTRPLSAYNYFTRELYQSGEVKGFGNAKEISDKWEKCSEDEKDKFLRMAKRERLVYIIKKRNYDAMIRKDLGKVTSAYNLFAADQAGEKMTLPEIFRKWKNSDTATKKKYQNKAIEAKEEFQKRVDKFKNRVYDKPKRGLGAFNFFFKHKYKDIREDKKDLNIGEMVKVMSGYYKKLTEKQMNVYEQMANRDQREKKEYLREYVALGYYTIKEDSEKTKKPRRSRDSEMVEERVERSSSKKSKKNAKSPIKSVKRGKKN